MLGHSMGTLRLYEILILLEVHAEAFGLGGGGGGLGHALPRKCLEFHSLPGQF